MFSQDKVVTHSFEIVEIGRISDSLMRHGSQINSVLNLLFKAYIICKVCPNIFIKHRSLKVLIVSLTDFLLAMLSTLYRFVLIGGVAKGEVGPS